MFIWVLIALPAPLVDSFHVISVSQVERSRVGLVMRDQNRILPDALKKRVEAGTITAYDLERVFSPNKKEIDRYLLTSSSGFSTVIFGLEGCLVDLDALYYQAYGMMASTANLEMPSKAILRDCIGTSFGETILAFGWDLSTDYESVFHNTLEKLMETQAMGNKMTIQPGAVLALERCIQQENTVIVNTALPRRLATRILGITQLSTLLAANVNPENLIHTEESTYESVAFVGRPKVRGDRRSTGSAVDGRLQLLRCCAQARTAPMLGLLVDVNRRNLLQAKRVGLSTIGLSDYAINKASLNSCDKVVRSLLDFKMSDAYSIVRRHVEMVTGMQEATDNVVTMVPPESSRTRVASPAEDDPKAIRDSFAEDGKSSDVL